MPWGRLCSPKGLAAGGKELFPFQLGFQQPAAPPGRRDGCLSATVRTTSARAVHPSFSLSLGDIAGKWPWMEGVRSWGIPGVCQGLLEEAVVWVERAKNRRGRGVGEGASSRV